MPDQEILLKQEAADFLRIEVRTLERYMQKGIIPFIKIGRGRRATVRFRRSEILAKLDQYYTVGLRAS